jgi:hypothetical protein
LNIFLRRLRAVTPLMCIARWLKFKDFRFPVHYIMLFSAEFRADEDYLPAGTEILLIILLVMNLFQSLG